MTVFMDLERAQTILKREGIDVLLSNRPENVTYVSGFSDSLECRIAREQWTYALVFASAPPTLVVPWFEVPNLRDKSEVEAIVANQVWVEASSPENPAGVLRGNAQEAVAHAIREHRLSSSKVGIDERFIPLAAFQQLQAQLPDARFVPATAVFEEIRLIKTPAEIIRLEQSVGVVEQGYQALASHLQAGVRESDLTSRARDAILDAGADDVIFNFVTSGVRAGIDHVTGGDDAIKAGEVVKCDIGAHYGGYCSDFGRSFACGELSRQQRRIYGRILETEERVLAAAKPGATGSDLFRIYLEGMRGGYGEVPWDMIGHGIGLEVHEVPILGPLDHRPLQPGMVLCVEIGYLDPGRQGYQLEDEILITGDGNRPLTSLRKDLIV